MKTSRQWQAHLGDCVDFMRTLPDLSIDHVIADPPYSEAVHSKARTGKKRPTPLTSGGKVRPCSGHRTMDLGFQSLSPKLRKACAVEFARIAKRWVAVFSDVESCHLWRDDLVKAGLTYKRTAEWRRIGGAPQFSGDRPAVGFECITLAHRTGKRSVWNGGGKAGSYEECIVANRGGNNPRNHTTEKPIALMLSLVGDFTAHGDSILDPFMGSGTTGVAAIRLHRNFIGCELDAAYHAIASERMAAEVTENTLRGMRSGQLSIGDVGGGCIDA